MKKLIFILALIAFTSQAAPPPVQRGWETTNSVAVQRLLHGTYVNVKAPPYNATGDGTTDDTVAISRARTNRLVFFPAGTYLVGTNTALVTNNCTMFGEPGELSVLKWKTGEVGSGDSYLGNFLFKNPGFNAVYRDLVFDGQHSGNLSAAQSGTTNSEPRNTTVERNGIFLSEAATNGLSVVRNCVFRNFNGHAIFVRGSDTAQNEINNRFLVTECSFTNNYQGVLTSDAGTADYTRVVNNFFWKNYIGWEFRGANVTFALNQMTHNYEAIFGNCNSDGRSHNLIENNTINHHEPFSAAAAPLAALYLNGCRSGLHISGNTFSGGADNYFVNATYEHVFSNNRFNGVTNYVDASSSNITFTAYNHFESGPPVDVGPNAWTVIYPSLSNITTNGTLWPKSFVLISESLPNNTSDHNGATPTSLGWTTRRFNTLDAYAPFCITNAGAGNSGSNSFSLARGEYQVDAWSTAAVSDRTTLMLSNVTTGAISIMGMNFYAPANVQVNPTLSGRISVTDQTNVFVLRQYFANGAATGFGYALNTGLSGVGEIYTKIRIEKE